MRGIRGSQHSHLRKGFVERFQHEGDIGAPSDGQNVLDLLGAEAIVGAVEDFPQDGDRPLDERRADFPQHRLGDVHRLAALPLVLAIDVTCVESVGLLRGDHALDLFEQALCVALRSIGRKVEARFDRCSNFTT